MKRSAQKRRTSERKARQAKAFALYCAALTHRTNGGPVPTNYRQLSAIGRQFVAEFYNDVSRR